MDIVPSTYREFLRSLNVYGIYNIPVLVQAVQADNNLLAFAQFLRVVRHPEYARLRITMNSLDNLALVESTWPTQEERMDVIQEWWNASCHQYDCFEDILAAIDNTLE